MSKPYRHPDDNHPPVEGTLEPPAALPVVHQGPTLSPLIVAERHGVILGAGDTKEAAAAAAAATAARVSRVEIRPATVLEHMLWFDGRLGCAITRLGIDSERALLEATRTDINRTLRSAVGCHVHVAGCTPEREFPEYRIIDTDYLDPAEWGALFTRIEAIDKDLRELAFLERQSDLFAAVPA